MRPHDRSAAPFDHASDARRVEGKSPLPTALGLAHRVAQSIGSAHLAEVLVYNACDAADYEASVQGGNGTALRAGRMMIERASGEILTAIAAALEVALPPTVPRWLDVALQHGVPLIVGWDLRGGGTQRCVKLYVNASDASVSVREELCQALVPQCNAAAAVVGMNARADGVVETKVYVQSNDATALARGLSKSAEVLAAAARADGADAGGIVSFDADGTLRPRAFFVALREPADDRSWHCIRSLAGYDDAAIAALLPFEPAPPRSVGIALGAEGWTLYFKPRHSGRAPEALEPAAIFRAGGTEVGVFVEPTEHAARAFRRTARHAISIRVRAGAPTPAAIESLVDWFASRVQAAERVRDGVHMTVSDPPAPWQVVPDRGEPG